LPLNILITGANGYIGQRLIPVLLEQGHHLYCCVRDKERFEDEHRHADIHTIEIDFLKDNGDIIFPSTIDAAYFLIHSMSTKGNFEEKELVAAVNFLYLLEKTNCRQIIYLSGIVNEERLSKHLHSRLAVEKKLTQSNIPVTVLRAGIIVGSGSASFEIIRDLVEKLPVMIAPRWLNTQCQPIAVRNVIQFLSGILLKELTYNRHYDISGPDVLTYKQMLLQFAEVRKLRRWIFILPVMTPRLSSYWLYFITSTSYPLAVNLVNSMKITVIAEPNSLAKDLGIELLKYKTAVQSAFEKIEQNMVLSSWKDSFSSSNALSDWMERVEIPSYGCFKDLKWRVINNEVEKVLENVWSIGGERGWYYGNKLWKIRGLMDKVVGGVGLRRGRTNTKDIHPGDALDFWRVLVADKNNKRLLLFAEMKLPGEAWLEFRIMKRHNKIQLRQTATFRPRGLWGRLYWYSVLPFHYFIFNGMINNLVKTNYQKSGTNSSLIGK
jgi:uncharacterized protein YbjT (DUF2867 family)